MNTIETMDTKKSEQLAKMDEQQREQLKTAFTAIDDKFGIDIQIVDIRGISILADFYIIASGANKSQIKAMADEVALKLHKLSVTQRHIEGYNSANWVLIDFGSIIVHIFDKENREFYNIEKVWGDAPRILPEDLN